MYHDSYTRRRTADSFNESKNEIRLQKWPCKLLFGVIIIQVTSRMIWASFGVISFFLLDEKHSVALLLAPSIAFLAASLITELGAKRLCKKLVSPVEFTYVTIVGTFLSWGGVFLTFKSPLVPSYYVPLLGVLGGCGTGLSSASSSSLLQKHFKNRNWVIRVVNQATASTALFLAPVLSYFLMESFGTHGGLLLHSAIILQGLIGAALMKNMNWNNEDHPNVGFINSEDGTTYPSNDSSSSSETNSNKKNPTSADLMRMRRLRRRRRRKPPTELPMIYESEEEDEPFQSEDDHLQEANESFEEGKVDITVECEIENSENDPKDISTVAEARTEPVNILEKPPRTFQHEFSPERLLAKKVDTLIQVPTEENEKWEDTRGHSFLCSLKNKLTKAIKSLGYPKFWFNAIQLIDPRFLTSLILLFAIELALLSFLALTPLLLELRVEDVTRMDGSYVIGIMGFTWLCCVVASPCLTTAHFTNHQRAILVSALLISSLTFYMMTTVASLDGLTFFCSIFGLAHGLCNITLHNVLKSTLGSKRKSRIYRKLRAGLSVLFLILMGGVWEWAHRIQDVYHTNSLILAGSAVAVGTIGGVTSVRAARGRHDVTWSRRRRLS